MNELSALRRLALSSAKCCARIHRRGNGTDAGIAQVLNSCDALTAIIAAAHRISAAQIKGLTDPVVTNDAPPAPQPTPADYEHVRFMNDYA